MLLIMSNKYLLIEKLFLLWNFKNKKENAEKCKLVNVICVKLFAKIFNNMFLFEFYMNTRSSDLLKIKKSGEQKEEKISS